MLYSTNSGSLRTRNHLAPTNHLQEAGLDLGSDESAPDHLRHHPLDQVEVEDVHYFDFLFQRLRQLGTHQ